MLSAVEDSPEQNAISGQTADSERGAPTAKRNSSKSDPDRDMGSALRHIYQRAVEEEIPDEMLSLLSKLD